MSVYDPITSIELYADIPLDRLSPSAKRLVVAHKVNKGDRAYAPSTSAQNARVWSRITCEDGFEIIQDVLLTIEEQDALIRRLRRDNEALRRSQR